ncbi:MAG TPA: competence/damage-inducible protein A [Clostridiaceae bacterium]|nr:competence/damage-inducible protein A [Clostridiaceae bacterium]
MSPFIAELPIRGRKINTAEIITVGTELLLGQTLNTNARDLALELSELGISSFYQVVVGDNPERLEKVLRQSLDRADLVITTGGLGPTEDDITMEISAKIAGTDLVCSKQAEGWIREFFAVRGRKPSGNNWKQALLPLKSKILYNSVGTAPGALYQLDHEGTKKYLALLPGPPAEMKQMFQQELKPWLETCADERLYHVYLRTIGLGESSLTDEIADVIHAQNEISIAPYASLGEVMLRLSLMGPKEIATEELEQRFSPVIEQIKSRVGEYIYSEDNKTLPEVVLDLLAERQATVGFAESCTGGLISAELTKIPGASKVFTGGVVSYSNEIKKSLLGVSSEVLRDEGAVSEGCALAMAAGARSLLGVDYAVAITGIAGPEGGSKDKPVGTIWIGLADEEKTTAQHFLIGGDRAQIRKIATLTALDVLRKRLLRIV